MEDNHGFKLLRKQAVAELNTTALVYEHGKTGARLLSMINDDENKVFGVTFRTPPKDSTGVAHILEHSVLCGSRKYPVKEPFVELLKGSLQTFLNAFTYPDRTCYPVASQNKQDFYNLIDVYLDAVFYPRLSPKLLRQEGWRLETRAPDQPFSYTGVVYSEMKGAYSSPERLLAQYSQEALFPDTLYSLDSGGAPGIIPELTYDQFKTFHDTYYHPSNAFIYFYGDDDPEQRLALLAEYLDEFSKMEVDSSIPLQTPFNRPGRIIRPVIAGQQDAGDAKGFITVNWLLPETIDIDSNLALTMLEYILLGMPASPLRKALIDSGLGQDIVGVGLESDLRQMYFSTGLKGVEPQNSGLVEELILNTIKKLADKGIHHHTIEAAMNTIEFRLRENNSGQFPRGLFIMLRALNTWLYDGDPLSLISFEGPLNKLKANVSSDDRFFEKLLQRYFIENNNRVTVILEPDVDLAKRQEDEERDRLNKIKKNMTVVEAEAVIREASELKRMQETPDSPEALATIPRLTLEDLPRRNKQIPIHKSIRNGAVWLKHNLPTNRIVYFDFGLDLRVLPQKYLPYMNLFGRALLEMGAGEEDFVTFSQRIGRKTGGVRRSFFTSQKIGFPDSAAWFFLRGKVMADRTGDLLDILRDALLNSRLDNKERFRQMTLEAIARHEERLLTSGHSVVNLRIRSHFSESGWVSEQIHGFSALFFLRGLVKRIDEQWGNVLDDLKEMRRLLVNRSNSLVNLTYDEQEGPDIVSLAQAFQESLPSFEALPQKWTLETGDRFEGLVIPTQVNYVGKGANLYEGGYIFHGSALVILRYLRNSLLWQRVRVQGGAYGALCLFDRMSGTIVFVSYRDPNLMETLNAFDDAADYLRNTEISDDELTKAIIGAIGDIDDYLLPDAKGFISMARDLAIDTDDNRQRMREEALNTSIHDFRNFADYLERVANQGLVKIVGSKSAFEKAVADRPGWLKISTVL